LLAQVVRDILAAYEADLRQLNAQLASSNA
jgi:hypothetical protein